MRSFAEAILEATRRLGTADVRTVARAASKLRPLKLPTRQGNWPAVREVIAVAASGYGGVYISALPEYTLTASGVSGTLPRGRRLRAVVEALRRAATPMPLPTLVEAYASQYGDASVLPLYQMFWHLEQPQFGASRYIKRIGDIEVAIRAETPARTSSPPSSGSIAFRLDEKSLEKLLTSRLDLIEEGLTLIKRQFSVPVGRIDLLCRDRDRNLVVVEIKRPSAEYREVVGQILTYIGWVRTNMAGSGQTVRGIIIIGRADERLQYAANTVDNLSVRTFL